MLSKLIVEILQEKVMYVKVNAGKLRDLTK